MLPYFPTAVTKSNLADCERLVSLYATRAYVAVQILPLFTCHGEQDRPAAQGWLQRLSRFKNHCNHCHDRHKLHKVRLNVYG